MSKYIINFKRLRIVQRLIALPLQVTLKRFDWWDYRLHQSALDFGKESRMGYFMQDILSMIMPMHEHRTWFNHNELTTILLSGKIMWGQVTVTKLHVLWPSNFEVFVLGWMNCDSITQNYMTCPYACPNRTVSLIMSVSLIFIFSKFLTTTSN